MGRLPSVATAKAEHFTDISLEARRQAASIPLSWGRQVFSTFSRSERTQQQESPVCKHRLCRLACIIKVCLCSCHSISFLEVAWPCQWKRRKECWLLHHCVFWYWRRAAFVSLPATLLIALEEERARQKNFLYDKFWLSRPACTVFLRKWIKRLLRKEL